jgi:hypothetical protein
MQLPLCMCSSVLWAKETCIDCVLELFRQDIDQSCDGRRLFCGRRRRRCGAR